MAIGDLFRLSARFVNDETGKNNFIHFDLAQTGAAEPAVTSYGPDVVTWWSAAGAHSAALRSYYAPTIHLDEVLLRKIQPLAPLVTSFTLGLPIAGQSGVTSMGPRDALLLSFRTANIGRSFRGRDYLPPPAIATLQSAGEFISAVVEDVVDATQELQTAFGAHLTDPANMVVVSAFSGHTLVAHPDGTVRKHPTPRATKIGTIVTLIEGDTLVRSVRKRGIRTPHYASP